MVDPVSFTSQTPRFGLPMLFSGQAQKEFYLNEAHALIDGLLHPIVEGISSTASQAPQPGECWIVSDTPDAEWAGHEGDIACFQSGMWLFANAVEGMRAFDRSTGNALYYRNGWSAAEPVTIPQDGTTVDAEARTAIQQLVEALVTAGILPATA